MSDYEDQQRKKRLEDLENKRKRLEEMRKLKKDRSTSTGAAGGGGTTTTTTSGTGSSGSLSHLTTSTSNIDVDDLVNSLLSPSAPSTVGPAAENNNSSTIGGIENLTISSPMNIMNLDDIRKTKAQELVTVSNVVQVNIFPSFTETYEKETQANLDDFMNEKVADTVHTPHRRARSESVPPAPHVPTSPVRNRAPSYTDIDSLPTQETKKNFSSDELNTLLGEDTFKSFIKSSSHVMARALGLSNSIDILKDYTGADRGNSAGGNQSAIMSKVRNYSNLAIQDRPIMDIQVSPHHSELFLVAYGSKSLQSETKIEPGSYDNQPGLLCLWTLILTDTPEFIFTAPSPVLTARFHTDDPHIIIGGCYSGQIVMWDTRAMSHRPTSRSAISGKGHKHPVYSMCLAKSGVSSPILITASTDGTLCHWDLANLNDPNSSTMLLAPLITHSQQESSTQPSGSGGTLASYMLVNSVQSSRGKPVSASCMSLGPDEENRKLIVGTEGGALCLFTLPFKSQTQFEQVTAHYGMITAITMNPSTVKPFRDLILTSSVDWTVKLWNIQRIGTAPSPIFEFSASAFDYYSSVRWCPIHPGIFTTITSGGVLMLWNLCQSVVEPVGTLRLHQEEKLSTTTTTSSTSTAGASAGGGTSGGVGGGGGGAATTSTTANISALNKTVWISDGKKLLIGDSRGNTNMISIRPSVVSLRAGDEMKLEFYLESSSIKISSLTSNTLRSMSGLTGSRDVLDEYQLNEENISLKQQGLDETKGS